MTAPLRNNDQLVKALQEALHRGLEGRAGLQEVPRLLHQVLGENRWQHRVIAATGQEQRFDRFQDFITAPPPAGLGITMELIRNLCGHDTDVINSLDALTSGSLDEQKDSADRSSKPTLTIPLDPEKAARCLAEHFTEEQWAEFLETLDQLRTRPAATHPRDM